VFNESLSILIRRTGLLPTADIRRQIRLQPQLGHGMYIVIFVNAMQLFETVAGVMAGVPIQWLIHHL